MAKTDADLIAEFLASKGATKCAEGARAYNPRDIYTAQREGGKARALDDLDASAAEIAAERLADTMAEARHNGHRVTGYDSAGNVYLANGRRY